MAGNLSGVSSALNAEIVDGEVVVDVPKKDIQQRDLVELSLNFFRQREGRGGFGGFFESRELIDTLNPQKWRRIEDPNSLYQRFDICDD